VRETEALHSTAKIRLVQHCAATSATAELMFSQRRRNEISRLQSADEHAGPWRCTVQPLSNQRSTKAISQRLIS